MSEPETVFSAPPWFRRVAIRHVMVAGAVAVFAWLSAPLWVRYLPDSLVYSGEFREARRAIEKIERFRRASGVLPPDLCTFDLPCDESAPLQYNPTKDGYSLSFGAGTHGFFSSLIYESGTQRWHVGD